MAYKSPFNQDPTLKKAISNVFGKTNLPNFGDKKYGGERLYEQPVKGSDYSVPVSDFSDEIGGAPAGSTTSTPKGRIDRLKARKDATSNEAKKARIQGKIERTETRQSSRAERIKDKNIKRLQKTKQRQKIKNIRQGLDPNAGMKDYKSEFKKMGEDFGKKDLSIKKSSSLSDVASKTEFVPSSGGASSITPKTTTSKTTTPKTTTPKETNTFFDDKKIPSTSDILGNELISQATRSKYPDISIGSPTEMIGTMASRLQAALGIGDGKNLMSQGSGGTLANVGSLIGGGTRDATPAPVAPMAPTGGDMQDPFAGKTFSIVESPTNMKGGAKPVFNESTSDAAAMMYGSPVERQMSMPRAGTSAMAMSAKQAENLPPELVAEIKKKEAKEGSDGSSPVEFHEGVSHDKKMLKTLTEKKIQPYTKEQLKARNKTIKNAENETTMRAFGVTTDGKKVNLGTITSTEIPFKDFKQR